MIDVFISYARDDKHRARDLADALKERGFRVWWDWDFFGCEDIRDAIRTAIGNASKVVVLWSLDSIESPLVIDEAREANRLGKLVSVSIDGSAPPSEFGDSQFTSLVDPETGLEKLVAVLEGRAQQDIRAGHVHLRRLRHVLTGSALALGLSMAAVTFFRDFPQRLPDLRAQIAWAFPDKTAIVQETVVDPPKQQAAPQIDKASPNKPELPEAASKQAASHNRPDQKPAGAVQKVELSRSRPPMAGVCVVSDPAGTPMSVRAQPQGEVVSTLTNGRSVLIADVKNDDQGQPWVLVANNAGGERLGWVSGKNVTCP